MRRRYAVFGGCAIAVAAVLLITYALRSPSSALNPPEKSDPPASRIAIKEISRDLGVLDPSDKCRHTFIICNEGDAPLYIKKVGTTCKCTVASAPREIPPGKAGPIAIESKTEGIEGPFSHTAAFATNDPERSRIELTIHGDVRRYLVAAPSGVHDNDLGAGAPMEFATLIFSEVWDSFELSGMHSTQEGVTWDIQPAPQERLAEYKYARSGYVATLHTAPGWTGMGFSGKIEVDARPAAAPDARHQTASRKICISFGGRRRSLGTVYGPKIDSQGIVRIGALERGRGGRAKLLLKVRGDHRRITVKEIEKTPDFLKVRVFAESSEMADKGLYRVIIEVPPDAPPGSFVAPERMGTVKIVTDHPEMPEIAKLKVSFAVLSDRGT
ncbi:MAG: DUF1573 domain-containing protein [Pirellulales bacterium]|nr:DUF1573 domain-containing protein [Pirellulales bacterium]